MPAYTVAHRYEAYDNGQRIGPFTAGQTVQLDAERAQWVNRDSPGCLMPVAAEPEPQRAANRVHKGGRNRGT